MVVSANTLFHFCKKENLIGILKDNFHPHYHLEDFSSFFPNLNKKFNEYAIPMCCFCDLPLSNIKDHIVKFGPYGIGLSKEWGMRNRLNPIMYLYNGSFLTNTIKNLYHSTFPLWDYEYLSDPELSFVISDIEEVYRHFLAFVKPYQIIIEENGNNEYDRIYDEREWRYVPIIEPGEGLKSYLEKCDFQDEIIKNLEEKKLIEHKKLEFEPDDIKYIISL